MKPSTHYTDALIRQRLGELPDLPPDPAGWERLQAALETDPDLHLRNSLTGLIGSEEATGWEALERKMNPLATADARIATALESLQPAVPAHGWPLLARQLDELNNDAVDAVVVNRLENSGTETVVSGWAALAARLELIGRRRGLIAAGKISEVSILLSLLLLFIRFGPTMVAPPTPAPLPVAVAATDVASASLAANDRQPTGTASAIPSPGPAAVLPEAMTARQLTAVSSPARRTARALPLVSALPVVPVTATGTPTAPAVTEREAAAGLPTALAQPPYSVKRAGVIPSPALQLPRIDHSVPIRYHANFFVSPFDVNQVITPATSIGRIDIAGDDRITQGLSAGVLIDISQAKNGLQIGLIYSERSYIPTALKWYLQEEYSAVEPLKGYSRFIHQALTIPFHYTRTVVESDKWRFSVNLGASMNIIAKSDFYIPDGAQEELVETLNGRLDRFDLPDPNGSSSGRSRNTGQSRTLVEPPAGWLEGGSMLENANFYLGGGITAERLLTPRLSFYVSPSVGRAVYMNPTAGIGPYGDRIHLGNLRFGSRYLLSKK